MRPDRRGAGRSAALRAGASPRPARLHGSRPAGRLRLAGPRLAEASPDLTRQSCEGDRQGFAPRHDHIIMVGHRGEARGSKRFPEPALDAVAHDGAADLLGHRQTDAGPGHGLVRGLAAIDLEAQTSAVDPAARRRPNEIRTDLQTRGRRGPVAARGPDPAVGPVRRPGSDVRHGASAQADRRLRPRARRAAMILRPPTVAMRARKPWRRLRTILLG